MAQPPFLHDLAVVVKAPAQVWSRLDGQITGAGLEGVCLADERVLALATLAVAAHDLVPTGRFEQAADVVRFDYVIRREAGDGEPALTLTRLRQVTTTGVRESLRVAARLELGESLTITMRFQPDATPMAALRAGGPAQPVSVSGPTWHWRGDQTQARLSTQGGNLVAESGGLVATWELQVPAGGAAEFGWELELADRAPFLLAPTQPWSPAEATSETSEALSALLSRSLSEVESLRLADKAGNVFLAAGAPWYFTLFGRDSLLSARFLLPIDSEVALGTLRALAAQQGKVSNPATGEQPGKIPHELRREALPLADGTVLPPVYYGTIDATPLWIVLLHETWRAGVAFDDLAPLLDNLVAALHWLRDHADADGDGFIEYAATDGGLVNQGWKDSKDSVRFADGRVAEGPIALAEVQAYAYAAARGAARLLASLGRTPTERAESVRWDQYAEALAGKFRERFWVGEGKKRYPAMALDGKKERVDSVTSNIGHLVGTGLLNREEETLVVSRLLQPDMFNGYGIRTMSASNPAYWPLSYHNGSVWPHDNALIIDNLRRAGFAAEARRIAEGQLRAAAGMGYSLPELFGGQGEAEVRPPHPYPSSCRPQAWAAAGAVPIARALGVTFG